jgi:dienelactone hydrolase
MQNSPSVRCRRVRTLMTLLLLLLLAPIVAFGDEPAPAELRIGSKFAARDSLACGDENNADAKECLANLSWEPIDFTVQLDAAKPGCGDWLVRFPSARPIGSSTNDLVAMEWFATRDRQGAVRTAPAMVVVHESGRDMTVGRLIARGLSGQGLHAFLIHLPGYGARRVPEPPSIEKALPALQQAIADVRRARDAVAALPIVDSSVVGLQGTSLGGFVAATVAGLDHGYNRVFILLAGGNLHHVLLHGAKDAAKARSKLAAAGVTDDEILELAHQVEPLRLAHRLHAAETWLFSGKFDDVVPPRCSLALARAAQLPDDHHVVFSADHYSGIVYLPQVAQQMVQRMLEREAMPSPNKTLQGAQ